ncbi:MAG: 50S ribosomal protein L6 [Pseudomonadota bacterium]
MSRVLKEISIPAGVEVKLNDSTINVKGTKGQLDFNLHESIDMVMNDGLIRFEPKEKSDAKLAGKVLPMVGTTKAIVSNMMNGVSVGYEKKLTLIGVGYRTNVQGSIVNLSLGFSHPVAHQLPEGITAEATSQTELIIRGIDKHMVGQVAAKIRSYRPPEPYKGKGIRYADEQVVRKDAKKK